MIPTDQPEPCVFCRVVRGDFGTEFVAQSEHAVAFRDLQPQAPVHILVAPRRHVADLSELVDDTALAGELLLLCRAVALGEGIVSSGYRVITNAGPDAGQSVFHVHLHVLGGRQLGPLLPASN
ncbi:MAG: HIT domain-containing protein [Chloroflexia bacterium]|jgi:histidine triad (HIT) family protein|nr:HIT domain-containing protein [Chloroflexia bacterium]